MNASSRVFFVVYAFRQLVATHYKSNERYHKLKKNIKWKNKTKRPSTLSTRMNDEFMTPTAKQKSLWRIQIESTVAQLAWRGMGAVDKLLLELDTKVEFRVPIIMHTHTHTQPQPHVCARKQA